MVRNHAWWRDEPDVIRERLRGVRHLIEELLVYVREDGLLGRLPGWSFVDWVPEWFGGYPPGHAEGDSSIIQMHWLMSLQAAADLEEHFGEPELRRRWIRLADAARTSLITRYRNPENGLFYDDSAGHLSEHANALATLLGLRPPGENTWPETLEASGPVFRCTVYFSHYLFEAYRLMRRTDLFTARLDLWKGFLNSGLCTIPEQPEPSRSDCHAWGSHPLFHFHASFAGIRPASPGFRTVKVEPLPGKLPALAGSLPHPRGKISYDFRFSAEGISGTLHLPDGLTGELEYGGRRLVLTGGENVLG